MLSYKNWKTLNESAFGSTNLGISQIPQVGTLGNVLTITEAELLEEMKKKIKEAKKKMRKKMGLEGDEEASAGGDGEVVPPAAKKDADPNADDKAAADSKDGDMDGNDKKDTAPDENPDADNGDSADNSEDDADDDDFEGDDSGNAKEFMKKGGKKKKVKKEAVETEEDKWIKSVKSMLDPACVSNRNWDGLDKDFWKQKAPDGEPGPGQPGFAPQQRFGL